MTGLSDAKLYAANLTCEMRDLPGDGNLPQNSLFAHGGFDPAPDWDEFLAQYPNEYFPYLIKAKEWVKGQDPWIGGSEFAACNYLYFSDGVSLMFSWRAWGDFLQAVAGRREGYLEYYLNYPNPLVHGFRSPLDGENA